MSCQGGYSAVVKLLIEHSVEVNRSTLEGMTPVHYTAMAGNTDVLRCLVEAGADLETVNESGTTALMYASRYGRVGTVIFLLQYGANIEQVNMNDNNPLLVAAFHGHMDVVRVLVQRGANKDSQSPSGTALYRAVQEGHLAVVQYLIQKGADVNIRGGEFQLTPLEKSILSLMTGQDEITKFLLDHGAITSTNLVANTSPLMCAIRVGKLSIVRNLVHHGADLTSPNATGMTHVAYARTEGHEDVATFLLEQGAV